MKKLLITLLAVLPMLSFSQDKAAVKQMYSVHEDFVKPSKYVEYEKICKELLSMMKENNIQDGGWLTTKTSDFRYWYLMPVENFADFDKGGPIKTLTDKVGKEKMDALWTRMDKCYDKHGTFTVSLDTELSYMPEGIDQNPSGENWRKFHYWHFAPENEAAARKKAIELQKLTTAKNSPIRYRVYRSGFGTSGPYYLTAFNAVDAEDFGKRMKMHMEACGPELMTLLNELFALADKYEEVDGMVRDDLSYMPQTKVSAVKK